MMPTSGTTAECLDHFFRSYNWGKLQAFVVKFAGVSPNTVRRWYNGSLPTGKELMKVRVLLDLADYRVEEFSILPDDVKKFARLIAFEAITVEGARELLDYKNAQDVYRVVLRSSGLTPHRQYRLTTFVEQSLEELEMMVAEAREDLEKLQSLKEVGSFRDLQAEEKSAPSVHAEAGMASEEFQEEKRELHSEVDVPSSVAVRDEEALAQALVSAVQLTKFLAQALSTSSDAPLLRSNVRFALAAGDIDIVIGTLEDIRDS